MTEKPSNFEGAFTSGAGNTDIGAYLSDPTVVTDASARSRARLLRCVGIAVYACVVALFGTALVQSHFWAGSGDLDAVAARHRFAIGGTHAAFPGSGKGSGSSREQGAKAPDADGAISPGDIQDMTAAVHPSAGELIDAAVTAVQAQTGPNVIATRAESVTVLTQAEATASVLVTTSTLRDITPEERPEESPEGSGLPEGGVELSQSPRAVSSEPGLIKVTLVRDGNNWTVQSTDVLRPD